MTIKLVVHEFRLGDVDDPEIYAAQPIYEWQQTEKGKWVVEHSVGEPYWAKCHDLDFYYYRYRIVAEFTDQDAVYYQLKYGYESR